MALLSMRADRFLKKTRKKITIQGTDVAGFDKSKVECFNCHKIGHFARECRAPRSQDRGRRENYKQGSKEEEPAPKALMAIGEVGWDWSYMANEKENHALVADDEALTEFALMAKSSSSFENKEVRDLIRTRRVLDTMLFPLPAQVYSPPKKDMSWTRLPEFADDTITDYIRPSPSIESNTSDLQNSNSSISEHGESSSSILSKPMIKFVKAGDCAKVKTNKVETARKSSVKYDEIYRNTSKSPKVRGNQRNWNNLKTQQLANDFVMKNKACFKCGHFDHLAYNCGVWVEKGKTWPKNNYSHKSTSPKTIFHKTSRTPMRINRPNMNVAQPKRTSFTKTAHSYVKRHFQGKSTVRTQFRVLRVPTVTKKFPTIDSKVSNAKSTFSAGLGNKRKAVKASAYWIWRPKQNTNDKGPNSNSVSVIFKKYQDIDTHGRLNGCSLHMTGNMSYLSDYEPYDGGYVSFGQGGGKITGKSIIKTGKLEFENVYFVKDLKYNLFSVSQICDNKNSVLFTNSECIVLRKDFKLNDDTNVLLRTLRQHNMYSIDLNNIIPHKDLTCLVAKASADEIKGLPSKCYENDHTCVACLKGKQHKASCKTKLVNSVSKPLHTLHMDLFGPTYVSSLNHKWYCLVVTDDFSRFTWTFFLITKDETSGILRSFITEIENLNDLKVKIIRYDNGGEFRNKEMNEFCSGKGIKREFSNARTPQQNRVAKRRNRTLIEAVRIIAPAIGFLRPFGCHVMILNSLDRLGKFDAKGDEGTSSTNFSGTKDVASQDVSSLRYIAFPNWLHEAHLESSTSNAQDTCNPAALKSSGNSNPTATLKNSPANQMETLTVESSIPTVSSPVLTACLDDSLKTSSDTRLISKRVTSQDKTPSLNNILALSHRFEDILGDTTNSVDTNGVEADLSNMETSITASPTSTFRIHKDHPKSRIIGPVDTPVQTRHKSKEIGEHNPSWVEAMQEELLQFKIQDVWILVDCLKRVRPIGTKWVLKNKKDERGIVIRNKAKLVAQGYTQEEGIGYAEVFAPVARIEAIRLFLAYASFMGFIVYEMDVKSAFLYGTINEEVYVMQPPGEFEALMHDKFQMSAMGELNFFFGLLVTQKKDGIFLSQDKYICDILKKFGYSDVRSANTPMDKENPWGKDGPEHNVDFHQIVDFVEASHIRYALTINPTVYVSHIRDFWSTARIKTTNERTKILATVDEQQFLPLHDLSPSHPTATTETIPTETPIEIPILRQYSKRATQIAQFKALPTAADEPASLLRDDSQGEALPTVSGLDVGLDRENIIMTSALPHDSTPRVTSLDADEGNLEISSLKARIKLLEDKDRGSAEPTGVDATIKGRSMNIGEEARVGKSTERGSNDTEELVNILTSMDAANILTSGV
nr:hypothetical protein [Tanacetum cinerariifolium]